MPPWGEHGDTEAYEAYRQQLAAGTNQTLYELRVRSAADLAGAATAPPSDSERDEYAPVTWDDYIGQTDLKMHLKVRIAAALKRGDRLPHTLLVAEPGAGKTTIAQLIAQSLDRQLITLTKPVDPARLADHLFRFGGEPGILFVDEIHLWNGKGQQHALMQLTESQTLDTSVGTVGFPHVTVLAATTEPQDLVQPLKERFMIQPRWQPYSDDELAQIIEGMATRAGVPAGVVSGEMARTLAKASAGIPRRARALVVAARDMIDAGLEPSAFDVLRFTGTEADGLTQTHFDYLTILGRRQGGKAGLDSIVNQMGAHRREVVNVERMLVRLGYVVLTGNGRQVTAAGRVRLTAGRIVAA